MTRPSGDRHPGSARGVAGLALIPFLLGLANVPPCFAEPPEARGGAGDSGAAVESGEGEPEDVVPAFKEVLVVTATAREEDPADLPFVTEQLRVEELLMERQVRTVPEALAEVPGVMVQKTSHGQGSPYIRGFTGFRTVFLIDGIRLNNSVLREGPNQYWNTVDAFSLERLEVVQGPVSVLYGSDSVGGAVQALTRDPPPPGDSAQAGELHLRLATAERSGLGRLGLRGALGERLSYVLGFTAKDFGDLEAGGAVGRQPRTGYGERDADAKLRWDLADDTRLVAAWQLVDLGDAWRIHRTEFGVPWRGTTAGSDRRRVLDQRRELGYLRLERQRPSAAYDALTASISLHRQDEHRRRVRRDGRSDVQGFEVDTLGARMRLEKAARRLTWSYGAESYSDRVGSFREDFDAAGSSRGRAVQGPVADDAEYQLLGAYAQAQIAAGQRLRLVTGVRYTYAKADARSVADPVSGERVSVRQTWDRFTGSVRFLYDADREGRWRLFGGVSQAFRAPNLSDLTRFDSARSNEIETPAPGLAPEQFLAWELGVRRHSPRLRVELAGFHTDIENLIIRTPTGRELDGDFEVTKQNAGSGFSRGLELALDGRLSDRWSAFAAAAWVDGEVDTFPLATAPSVTSPRRGANERQPLDRLMPATGRLGVRYSPAADWWLEAMLTVVDRADRLSTRDRADRQRIPPGGTPGYQVGAVRGGLRVSRVLEFAVAVENLTDEEYRIHGSGLNEPGRNFVASVRVDF